MFALVVDKLLSVCNRTTNVLLRVLFGSHNCAALWFTDCVNRTASPLIVVLYELWTLISLWTTCQSTDNRVSCAWLTSNRKKISNQSEAVLTVTGRTFLLLKAMQQMHRRFVYRRIIGEVTVLVITCFGVINHFTLWTLVCKITLRLHLYWVI